MVLKDPRDFGYSDGAESEKYLERVFRRAKDLSSTRSTELKSYIRTGRARTTSRPSEPASLRVTFDQIAHQVPGGGLRLRCDHTSPRRKLRSGRFC